MIALSAVPCAALPSATPRVTALSDQITPTPVETTAANPTTVGPSLPGFGDPERLPDGPRILEGDVADLIVPLHGGLCTGTPIAGTVYIVTAAHCVLTGSGEVRKRAVVRDGVLYAAVGVLVDTAYHDDPRVGLDAAVLIMEQAIPGPSARVGSSFPDTGQVTLAGFQRVDGDGALMRVIDPNSQPAPKRAAGSGTDRRPFRAAGCVESVESLVVSSARVTVHCGLVPGASGGPLLTVDNGELVVVGVLSSVTTDLSANGVVPLDSLHELLEHPERYEHKFETSDDHRNDSRSPDAIDHVGL